MFPWKTIKYYECVSVILHAKHIYSMQNYTVIYGLSACSIYFFSHYLINGNIYRKQMCNMKLVCWFYIHVFILRGIRRNIVINVRTFLFEVRVIFVRLQSNLKFSRQGSQKSSKTKCHENLYSGSRAAPADRRRDGLTGRGEKRIAVFGSFVQASKTNWNKSV